ncbi:2OG-Fe(II) oxygenase family protein [Psychromonas sp. GE-S-Ul-11]|uniref:2OG-Fe(II) oxygenase family protein n=1 Tax=Psychromonas sp. GE-S-Ul-11 TaxID=3241170 RepID=UPI00390C5CDB
MSAIQLQRAQELRLPSQTAILYRESSVQHFWDTNKSTLIDAWAEWEKTQENSFLLNGSLFDKALREAITQAWQDPSKEFAVKDLLAEVAPDVYQLQLFDPAKLAALRAYLKNAWNAQIPLRPPYGIALNRGGAMLDKRSEGYFAAPSFQAFYQEVLDIYMRPISRLLFPEIIGFDTQTFGFSINYKPTTDNSLRPHSDASAVTLNVNLNIPGEEFTGSSVDFFDQSSGKMIPLTFTPGSAMLHRGSVVHTAQPIRSGERTNFVMWLFGNRGQTPLPNTTRPIIAATERWTKTQSLTDNYAPF